MLDSKSYLSESLDFNLVSYNTAFLNETKRGRPTHKTNRSRVVLYKVKAGEGREGACNGEAAESPYRLAIAFPLGDFHGTHSKEPRGSKEHSLKTTLPVSLEWHKRCFSIVFKKSKLKTT